MPKHRRSSAKSPNSRPVAADDPSRLPKWAIIMLWSVVGGVLAAVLLLIAAVLLILTPPPEPMEEYSAADIQVQQQLLSQVSREVFGDKPPVESKIRLSAEQVNSLLHFTVFAVKTAEQLGTIRRREAAIIRSGSYSYRSGIFRAEIPLLLGLPSALLGGAVVLRVEGFPAKHDDKIDVSLRSCRLGRIPIPIFFAERCANRALTMMRKREQMLRFDRADRKSTRLNSSHGYGSRMPSSA